MSSEQDEAPGATVMARSTPIFPVRNLEASLAYYQTRLGFQLDWKQPGTIASVSRDRCRIFLCQNDQGRPGAWAWAGVGDADAVHEELRRSGARIRHPPTSYPWAYELQVEDPDGNVLRLGSEPRPEVPRGEWLDMHGERWAPLPSGGWRRVPRY